MTMRPYCCACITGSAAREHQVEPSRCTRTTASKSSGAILCRVLSRRMPALLMSTSRRPKVATAASTRRCAPSGVAMSS